MISKLEEEANKDSQLLHGYINEGYSELAKSVREYGFDVPNIDIVRDQVYYKGEYIYNSKNLYIFLNCPNITDVVLASGWD